MHKISKHLLQWHYTNLCTQKINITESTSSILSISYSYFISNGMYVMSTLWTIVMHYSLYMLQWGFDWLYTSIDHIYRANPIIKSPRRRWEITRNLIHTHNMENNVVFETSSEVIKSPTIGAASLNQIPSNACPLPIQVVVEHNICQIGA